MLNHLSSNTLLADVLKDLQDYQEIIRLSSKISKRLIKELKIQRGFGLGMFLDVSNHLNNHEAVLTWTKGQLRQIKDRRLYDDDSLYLMLRKEFLNHLPSHELD